MFGRKNRAAQAERIDELEGKLALLAVSLRWYADPANWQRRATNEKGQPLTWEKSPTSHDRGDRARSALLTTETVTLGSPAPEAGVAARILDRFIRNAHGEPDETFQRIPPALDPLSVRMES